MSEDIETAPSPTVAEASARAPETRAPTAPRAGGWAWLVALLALVVGAIALWRVVEIEQGQAGAQTSLRDELGARLDTLSHALDQQKRDGDALRARLADADGVNNSLREELLGLGERSRHLEDAIANLAEQRLTGRDALALNEAEFLLQQAQERLALFNDAQAALAAYGLADSALAAAEDPVFAGVRQTIEAERQALQASKPTDRRAALDTIEHVRSSLASLPLPRAAVAPEASASSRWSHFLAQFVRISHRDEGDLLGGRDIGIKRSLAAIDLNAAAAALLARDTAGYKAGLARARDEIAASFDAQSAAVQAALAGLDRLMAAPPAPAVPELGNALKELRNLRATRALARPAANHPAAAAGSAAPANAAPNQAEAHP